MVVSVPYERAVARNGEVEIAYEAFGEPDGRPLLLIAGLDGQMLWWWTDFCRLLAGRGYRVVRYDHRDSGLSTHFTGHRGTAYTAVDMAGDALAVLDALGWRDAHLCGASMGAGLGQYLAATAPERVRTLTSMLSIPVDRPASALAYIHLLRPFKLAFRRYGDDRASQIRRTVDVLRLTYPDGARFPEEQARAVAAECHARHPHDPTARRRQLAASRAVRFPAPGLAGIAAPTLVIHGEDDPLVRPAGGRAVAARIPGARFVGYPGMGHNLPEERWTDIADELDRLTAGSR
ncbi:alpha/beta fold hydrolase [Kitasatospora sp. NPDC057904]|uniref:alpha/beta fold hydrolase n=1 Tax=unclassified Kitasatospora TaxID=2633591 RepID=UPI0036DB9C87